MNKKIKQQHEIAELDDPINEQLKNRRQFITKFGKLAAVTPIAVTTLMSTYSSKAMASSDDGFDVI